MRSYLLMLLIALPLQVKGQEGRTSDTIAIGEVVISSDRDKVAPGFRQSSIDSSVLDQYRHGTIADVLAMHSSIFIKSYGMGGSASPSFRGTGASHTTVTWNDIPITNPMLGQSDLSLIPAGLVDDVLILYGGASMQPGQGGIGGTISLETKPDWKPVTSLTLAPGAGSFGRYSGLARITTGNGSFQSSTKAFWQTSENNFPFLNTTLGREPVRQRRVNSQAEQKGLMQELYFRQTKGVVSARLWYEKTDRNLPSSILVNQPGLKETQLDESFRSMLNYNRFTGRGKISLTGAWFTSRLDYTNSLVSINSRNSSNNFTLKGVYEQKLANIVKLSVQAGSDLNLVKTNNYADNKSRSVSSVSLSAESITASRLQETILVREIIDQGRMLIPDFAAGLSYSLSADKNSYLKTNISRNSRLPSMNDLYWLPGGNPSLKNEYAWTGELSAGMKKIVAGPLLLNADLTLFRNDIRNLIQWHPGEYSYWSAANIRSVRTSGAESMAGANFSYGNFSTSLTGSYSYTRATTTRSFTPGDASLGKQLIYVPVNQGNCSLMTSWWKLYSSWNISMTGKRYLASDNSDYLEGYTVSNLLAGLRMNTGHSAFDLSFEVSNIFDASYEAIAYYPMPGRSYSINLLIRILK